MPIYEFYCPDNHKIYSFFARSLSYAERVPRCPDGEKFRMERMISSFAVIGRAKEKPNVPGGDATDDPRMEEMMASMESEFSGMDSENPDPKALARMMRRMTEMSGAKVPGEMEEMMRRMELGEDPEKLEAEFGETLESFDPTGGETENDENLKARLRALRRQPHRDPTLYEMSEFVPETAAAPSPPTRKKPAKR
jgi:hypothetical protein